MQAGEGGGLLSSVNLFEVILGGIDAGLGAGLILIAGGSADADRADLHFARRFRNRFALVLGNGVVSLLAYRLSAATLDAPHAPGCMLVTDRHISEFAIQ